MSRWGDEIYESDRTLDWFTILVDRPLLKEIAYIISPEEVSYNAWWLDNSVSLLEVILLIDKFQFGSTVFLGDRVDFLLRYKATTLQVWDSEWQDTNFHSDKYHTKDNRSHHRHVVADWFDRVIAVSQMWTDIPKNEHAGDFNLEHSLPYFSQSEFITELVQRLIEKTIFLFSEERQREKWRFEFLDIECAWVCADVISKFCTTYEISSISLALAEEWKDKVQTYLDEEAGESDYDTDLHANILESFDELKAVAEKYPINKS